MHIIALYIVRLYMHKSHTKQTSPRSNYYWDTASSNRSDEMDSSSADTLLCASGISTDKCEL